MTRGGGGRWSRGRISRVQAHRFVLILMFAAAFGTKRGILTESTHQHAAEEKNSIKNCFFFDLKCVKHWDVFPQFQTVFLPNYRDILCLLEEQT